MLPPFHFGQGLSVNQAIKPNVIIDADVIYFPSCITRMMGADKKNKASIDEVIENLCDKAGLKLFIAANNKVFAAASCFHPKDLFLLILTL